MGKFNLGEFALSLESAAVSDLDTSPVLVQKIPLEDILPNEWNFYALRDLGPLADSIAMEGLLDPLVVTPAGGGKYRLISGHRRRAAIEQLVKDKEHPREDLRLVPCSVRTYKSEAMAKLLMILANSTARVLTNAEIMKQAEQIELSLYQLQEEGYQFPGRMRDQVAAACKVSAPKLARLKVIREKLKAPELVLLFEKDKLSEQAAYALARLPEDFQARIARIMGAKAADIGGGKAENILKLYGEGWRWEPDLQCPDGKPCHRGDTFLRHDLESYDVCGGQKCCLKCARAKDSYSPCDRMCSKAKAARKEKKDKQEAQAAQEREKRVRQSQKETQRNAQRLLPAIDAAGLPDESKFNWSFSWNRISVGEVRQWAAGEFPKSKERYWSSPELAPNRLDNPAALAELFGCSTDFLLGLTDDFRPAAAPAGGQAPEPQPEAPAPLPEPPAMEADEPPAEGWIPLAWLDGRKRPTKDKQLAAVKYSADGIYMLNVARWFMGPQEWRYPSGSEIGDVEILGWFPLPED